MSYDQPPNILLAHAGTTIEVIRTREKPEPMDVRETLPVLAWELHDEEREWVLSPFVLYGTRASRWEWRRDAEDADGRWHAIEEDEPEEGPRPSSTVGSHTTK